MRISRTGVLFACLMLLPLLNMNDAPRAQEGGIGGLLVAPTRVVFGPRDRVAEVTLVNRATETVTYRISLVNKQMTERGTLEEITAEEAEAFTAERYVIFAPRQVVLHPNDTQKVRLKVRRPAGLRSGEYRSHLLIKPEPEYGLMPSGTAPGETPESRVQVGVRTTPALTIPIILRHGETSLSIEMADIALIAPDPQLPPRAIEFRLNRAGNQGGYGDVTIDCSPSGELVGLLRGVAVYTPNLTRLVRVPISNPQALMSGGVLSIRYQTPEGAGGVLLADGEISLP